MTYDFFILNQRRLVNYIFVVIVILFILLELFLAPNFSYSER